MTGRAPHHRAGIGGGTDRPADILGPDGERLPALDHDHDLPLRQMYPRMGLELLMTLHPAKNILNATSVLSDKTLLYLRSTIFCDLPRCTRFSAGENDHPISSNASEKLVDLENNASTSDLDARRFHQFG